MVFIGEQAAETPSRMHNSNVDVFLILVTTNFSNGETRQKHAVKAGEEFGLHG
jgi:hypothetical protein